MSLLDSEPKKKTVSEEVKILCAYIGEPVLNAYDSKRLKTIVLNHVELAEAVYRKSASRKNSYARTLILIELNKQGLGKELAYEEAHRLAYALEFKDPECSEAEELAFRKWFSCETDEMPARMPKPKYTVMGGQLIGDRQIACMSLVCEYTARQCVYGLLLGFIEAFKWPVREMLTELGKAYTKQFLNNLVKRYGVSEEDCMLMYSAIYTLGNRTKKETEFYYSYIEQWMSCDKAHYRETIMTVADQDIGKKIIKKLDLKGKAD